MCAPGQLERKHSNAFDTHRYREKPPPIHFFQLYVSSIKTCAKTFVINNGGCSRGFLKILPNFATLKTYTTTSSTICFLCSDWGFKLIHMQNLSTLCLFSCFLLVISCMTGCIKCVRSVFYTYMLFYICILTSLVYDWPNITSRKGGFGPTLPKSPMTVWRLHWGFLSYD